MERRETSTIAAAVPELAGKTIAVPETRELDVLAQLFEQRGATVIRCPLVAILDAPDPRPIEAWLRRFVAGSVQRSGLIHWGRPEAPPPVRGAYRAAGRVRRSSRSRPKNYPRTQAGPGAQGDRSGRRPAGRGADHEGHHRRPIPSSISPGGRVGVQLYGDEPNVPLMNFLATAGAQADPVAPYVYASNVDDERVGDLIERITAGAVDVIAFTSASQVRRLWDVARKRRIEAPLRTGLAHAVVAAVGPVTATEATRFGMNPEACQARCTQ